MVAYSDRLPAQNASSAYAFAIKVEIPRQGQVAKVSEA